MKFVFLVCIAKTGSNPESFWVNSVCNSRKLAEDQLPRLKKFFPESQGFIFKIEDFLLIGE